MIAYLILVHRYPAQFKKLFRAIYHANNHYVIHIDQKSGPALHAEVSQFLADYPNATVLESEKAAWGGYSLVNIELRGIKALLEQGLDWSFFINLSGQDFPLKSQSYMFDFLKKNKDKVFMKLANQSKARPDTLHRIEDFVTEIDGQIISEPIQQRAFMPGVTPYIGNQWLILSRKFCEFLSVSPEIDRFKAFYRNTLIADEGFFQTVIMNTTFKAIVVNDDKREIDWIPMGTIKLRPRDYVAQDAAQLMRSPNLFARKFDESIDAQILGLLEDHVQEGVAA